MPTYPLVNQKTGKRKELSMTISEYVKWKEENPDWDKDWSAGVAGVGEIGEWKDKLIKKHPSWNTILDKAGKMPNSNVKRIS
jgi:hypothetical protein